MQYNMPEQEIIHRAVQQLHTVGSDHERLQIFRDSAANLDLDHADAYELAATSLAVARDDTIDFALRVYTDNLESDRTTRFLVFATGAIACRRAQDKHRGASLFDSAGDEFADVPLFKHFLALSLDDGKLQELKRGLKPDFRS